MQGKTAIVTGAGRGIGAALSEQLAMRGAKVVLVARTEAQLHETADRIRQKVKCAQLKVCALDVSNERAVKDLWDSVSGNGETPQILVNNAGWIKVEDFSKVSLLDWQRTQDVNLTACFLMCREIFKRAKLESSILNVSSIAGVMGLEKFEGFAAYTAAKAGLIGFTESLAVEGRSRKIWANVICPGAVDTQMLQEALPGYKTSTKPPSVAERMFKMIERSFKESMTGKVEVLSNE
jgi:NAD(P)-dependent dehydrogenase (short-subunit alcohol dehydrogenase family)